MSTTTSAEEPTGTPAIDPARAKVLAKRKRAFKRVYTEIVFGLLLIAPAYTSPTVATSLKMLALYVPVWCVIVFLHEIGHLLAGLAMGMRFRQLKIGPMLVYVPAGGQMARLSLERVTWGGYCGMVRRSGPSSARQAFLFVAGGPITTALTCSVSVLAVALGSWNRQHPGGLYLLLFEMAVVSALILFTEIAPYMAESATRDFLWLWWLARDPETRSQAMAARHQSELLMQGMRPRDLPDDLFSQVLEGTAPAVLVSIASVHRYYQALDRGRPAEAIGALNELSSRISRGLAARTVPFAVEFAYFRARYHHAGQRAEAVLSRVKPTRIERAALLRTRAAIALANEDWDAAIDLASESKRHLVMRLEYGLAEAEHDWLDDIILRAEIGHAKQSMAVL